MARENINETYKKFAQKYGIKSDEAPSTKKRGKKSKEDSPDVASQIQETIRRAAQGLEISTMIPRRRQDVKNTRAEELEREIASAV
jgi:hypothetical protein